MIKSVYSGLLILVNLDDKPCATISLLNIDGHAGSHDLVPRNEEGLREVVFSAGELMMEVMEGTVVGEEQMEWIPRQPHPAIIIDHLHQAEGKEEYGGPW